MACFEIFLPSPITALSGGTLSSDLDRHWPDYKKSPQKSPIFDLTITLGMITAGVIFRMMILKVTGFIA
jgi:hypothetical protein